MKEYAGERFTLNQIDLTFCHGYIDYMLTNYRPKGKPISASTRNTYYQIFNGALNAAVRAKRILLKAQQTDDEFNALLQESIQTIYDASIQ